MWLTRFRSLEIVMVVDMANLGCSFPSRPQFPIGFLWRTLGFVRRAQSSRIRCLLHVLVLADKGACMLIKQWPREILGKQISRIFISTHQSQTMMPSSLSSRRKCMRTSTCQVRPPTLQLWLKSCAPELSSFNNIGFFTFNPKDSIIRITKSMSCAVWTAAVCSASVTDRVTLF
jgi:hypothetical protein